MSKKSFKIDKSLVLRPQTVAPSSPEEGEIYLDASFGYRKFENGFWSELGGGPGGINYIPSSDAEQGIGDWVTYADAAGVAPVDGIDGSPNITLTLDSVTPLRGLSSFLLTKDAANRQGEGVSIPFSIDKQDKNKTLYISFDYELGSGFSTDDVLVFVYDITEAKVITPRRSGSSSRFTGAFETSNSSDYRLIFHIATTSSSSALFMFDNVIVGPDKLIDSAIVRYIGSYTPTVSNDTGAMTNYNISADYWQTGELITIKGRLMFTGAVGTWTTFGITLPPNLTQNSAKNLASLSVGRAQFNDTGATWYLGSGNLSGSNVVRYTITASDGANAFARNVSNLVPFTFASGDYIDFYVENVAINQWANSSAVLSTKELLNQTLRVEATGGMTTINSGATSTLVYSTENTDTHGAYNNSTGIFTAPYKGSFFVNLGFQSDVESLVAGSDWLFKIQKNGSDHKYVNVFDYMTGAQSARIYAAGSAYVELEKGDTLNAAFTNNSGQNTAMSGGSDTNYLSIHQIPDFSVFSVYTEALKTQTKFVSSDQTVDGTLLTFSNLTIGQWYEVTIQAAIEYSAASNDNAFFTAEHNGNIIANCGDGEGTANILQSIGCSSVKFKAETTTLTCVGYSLSAATKILGDGTGSLTWAQLSEINQHQETNEW